MKSVHTILSSLLAGMMMFSLAACTASGTGASGSDSSAVQTDAVPQGRWVERQADGISSDWYSARRLPHWQMAVLYCMPGMRVPICRSLSVSTPRIMVPAGSLRLWTGPKKQAHWHAGLPARTAPWRLQPPTPPCGSYNRTATRFSWTWAWTGGISISTRWGSCPMAPWWLSRQADRVFLCREIFCFMMWMPKR